MLRLRNRINIAKPRLRHILNYLGLLVNSADFIHEGLSFFLLYIVGRDTLGSVGYFRDPHKAQIIAHKMLGSLFEGVLQRWTSRFASFSKPNQQTNALWVLSTQAAWKLLPQNKMAERPRPEVKQRARYFPPVPPSLPSNQACDRAHKDTSQSFVHGVAAQSWKLIASYELILRWSYRTHDTHPISISIKRALSGLQRDPSLSQALHLQHHHTEISAGMLFDKINDFNLQIWSGTAGGEQRSLVKTTAARCMDEQTKIYSICVLGISVTCGVEMKKQRRSAGFNHQRSTADLQPCSRS